MKVIKSFEELTDKLTIVDFFATWCGPCKMLTPVLEELAEANNEIEIVKVDVDESLDLARLYNISSVPTMLLFKNKVLLSKAIGYMDIDEINEWIENSDK